MNVVAVYTGTGKMKEAMSFTTDEQKHKIETDMQARAAASGDDITIVFAEDDELKNYM